VRIQGALITVLNMKTMGHIIVASSAVVLLSLTAHRISRLWLRYPAERVLQAISNGESAKAMELAAQGRRGYPFSEKESSLFLIRVIETGDIYLFRQLLDFRHPTHEVLDLLLFQAAIHSQYETASLLLERGANPDGGRLVRTMPASPLIVAIESGKTEIIKLLIDKKASVSLLDRKGYSPLLAAVSRGRADVVRILLEAGADPNAPSRDELRVYPLVLAALRGDRETLDVLAAHGAQWGVSSKTKDGATVDVVRAAELSGDAELSSHARSMRERSVVQSLVEFASKYADCPGEVAVVVASRDVQEGERMDLKTLGFKSVKSDVVETDMLIINDLPAYVGRRFAYAIQKGEIVRRDHNTD